MNDEQLWMMNDESWWSIMMNDDQNDDQWWIVDQWWYTMMNEDESWWSRMMIYDEWWRMQSRIRVQVSTTPIRQMSAAAAKILSTATDTIAQTYAIFMINDNEWWWIIKNDRCWWMMNDDEWWMMNDDQWLWIPIEADERATNHRNIIEGRRASSGSPHHLWRLTSNQL